MLWVNQTNYPATAKAPGYRPRVQEGAGPVPRRSTADGLQRPEALGLLKTSSSGATSTRSPCGGCRLFYFGLCVYDSEFEGVTAYVNHHVAKLSAEQHRVARFLALVTRYTQQAGIPVDLVRRWLGNPVPDGGDYAATLSSARSSGTTCAIWSSPPRAACGCCTTLVAEKVLTDAPGTDRYSLAQVAVDFITQVTEFLGPTNHSCRTLLAALFVRRSDWNENQRKENFAELIQAMVPNTEAAASGSSRS